MMLLKMRHLVKRDRGADRYPWFVAALLLAPAFFLPPIPIDGTRYPAVAWNMYPSGHWLVPSLDGMPYPGKPPLSFWLINLGRMLTGVHVLTPRALEVVRALATLPLLAALGRRPGSTAEAVRRAQRLGQGSEAMAGFAGGVMSDTLLAPCTHGAWQGALALVRGQLAKGAVGLPVGSMPALLAPWWYPRDADVRRSLRGRRHIPTTG